MMQYIRFFYGYELNIYFFYLLFKYKNEKFMILSIKSVINIMIPP